ncbi:sialic acid transporter [Actinomyces sp. oral taxon 180 str. F0310]|nr:sialic acid transporter [Actinomyces sp. oral taxon 180 str. F0310]
MGSLRSIGGRGGAAPSLGESILENVSIDDRAGESAISCTFAHSTLLGWKCVRLPVD